MSVKRMALLSLFSLLSLASEGIARDTNGDGLEVILIPIAFHPGTILPGQHGTRWRGAVWFHNGADTDVQLQQLQPCASLFSEGCNPHYPTDFTSTLTSSLTAAPGEGVLLSPPISVASKLTFSSRFWDTSTGIETLGVEVPIVREGDFFNTPSYLLGLQGGASVRTALRIYDPRRESNRLPQSAFRVEVLLPVNSGVSGTSVVASMIATTIAPPFNPESAAPGFLGVYDLAEAFPQILRLATFHIRITPLTPGSEYWAMVSQTNNATQQVVLVTAH